MKQYLLTLACWTTLNMGLSQSITVTFDGEPAQAPGTSTGTARYEESGAVFQQGGRGQVWRTGGGLLARPENGTAYLQIGADSEVELSLLNGMPFGLISVDLAEYSTAFAFPQTVFIYGYRADGEGASTTFSLDGVIDGTGPLPDFQTFVFDPAFTDLVRVYFPPALSIDNVVFTPVPEIGTGALLTLGLFAVLLWRWR